MHTHIHLVLVLTSCLSLIIKYVLKTSRTCQTTYSCLKNCYIWRRDYAGRPSGNAIVLNIYRNYSNNENSNANSISGLAGRWCCCRNNSEVTWKVLIVEGRNYGYFVSYLFGDGKYNNRMKETRLLDLRSIRKKCEGFGESIECI